MASPHTPTHDRRPSCVEQCAYIQDFVPFMVDVGLPVRNLINSCTSSPRWCAGIQSVCRGKAHSGRKRYKTLNARAPLDRHRSRVGALGEATSSKDQVMTYPYYVRILKPSPPTIYHGQGLAWGSHTGSYRSAMSKSKESTLTRKNIDLSLSALCVCLKA